MQRKTFLWKAESEARIQVFRVPVLSFIDQITSMRAEDCKPITSVLIMSLLSKTKVPPVPAINLTSLFLDPDHSNVAVTLFHYKPFLEFTNSFTTLR